MDRRLYLTFTSTEISNCEHSDQTQLPFHCSWEQSKPPRVCLPPSVLSLWWSDTEAAWRAGWPQQVWAGWEGTWSLYMEYTWGDKSILDSGDEETSENSRITPGLRIRKLKNITAAFLYHRSDLLSADHFSKCTASFIQPQVSGEQTLHWCKNNQIHVFPAFKQPNLVSLISVFPTNKQLLSQLSIISVREVNINVYFNIICLQADCYAVKKTNRCSEGGTFI